MTTPNNSYKASKGQERGKTMRLGLALIIMVLTVPILPVGAVDSSSSESQKNNTFQENPNQPDPNFTAYKVGEHVYRIPTALLGSSKFPEFKQSLIWFGLPPGMIDICRPLTSGEKIDNGRNGILVYLGHEPWVSAETAINRLSPILGEPKFTATDNPAVKRLSYANDRPQKDLPDRLDFIGTLSGTEFYIECNNFISKPETKYAVSKCFYRFPFNDIIVRAYFPQAQVNDWPSIHEGIIAKLTAFQES